MAEYAYTADPNTILRNVDQAYIPDDPANADYQAYRAWLAAGNEPTPYATPPMPLSDPIATQGWVMAQIEAALGRLKVGK